MIRTRSHNCHDREIVSSVLHPADRTGPALSGYLFLHAIVMRHLGKINGRMSVLALARGWSRKLLQNSGHERKRLWCSCDEADYSDKSTVSISLTPLFMSVGSALIMHKLLLKTDLFHTGRREWPRRIMAFSSFPYFFTSCVNRIHTPPYYYSWGREYSFELSTSMPSLEGV